MRTLEERIDIAEEPKEVWGVLRDFAGVSKWAPYVFRSRSIGDRATGEGSRRRMRHAWGFRLEEVVVDWSEGRGYSFSVVKVPYPMRDVTEAWSVEHSANSSTVTTTVRYRMGLGPAGKLADHLIVRWLVRREMREGLKGLKRYVESNGRSNGADPA